MKKPKSLLGLLALSCSLCAGALPARAQTQENPRQFEDALPDEHAGNITFTPFQNVDWELLAHQEIKDVNIEHPTAEQLARLKKHYTDHANEEGTDQITFSSPISAEVGKGTYYLISSRGMERLDLLKLSGQFMFSLNESRTALSNLAYTGSIVGKTGKEGPTEGGFVLHSETTINFSPVQGKFVARKEGKQDLYDYEGAGKKLTLSVPDEGLFEVTSVVPFKIGADEYVFVKWKPDTDCAYGCCEHRYSLFSVGDQLKLLRNNLSGCDV